MRWLDAPQCAETTCSDILKSTVTYNEVECKKDSKDDQQCHTCVTFNDCGGGRGSWDSGCLGVVTCANPDGNGDCVWTGDKATDPIKNGTMCVTSGITKFNVCTGYDLGTNLGTGTGPGCPTDAPTSAPTTDAPTTAPSPIPTPAPTPCPTEDPPGYKCFTLRTTNPSNTCNSNRMCRPITTVRK